MRKLLAIILTVAFMVTGAAGNVLADEKAAPEKSADQKMAGKSKNANGTVKMAAADSLVVAGKSGTEWTFAMDDKTMIKKGGKSITAADVKPGDTVQVKYMEHDGKVVAQRVTVKGGGTAKNPCATKK